jgi:hypothetical protein
MLLRGQTHSVGNKDTFKIIIYCLQRYCPADLRSLVVAGRNAPEIRCPSP